MPTIDAYKIKRLRLENFTSFRNVEMDFSPGINVIIGENGTGKTHLLKGMYGFLKGLSHPSVEKNETGYTLNTTSYRLEKLLKGIFKVEELSELITKGEREAEIGILIKDKEISFKLNGEMPKVSQELTITEDGTTVYLQPNEMISWYEGFISAYENRESSIDETYYFLAKALSLLPLKGEKKQIAEQLAEDLLLESGIRKVALERGRFVVELSDNKSYGAPLVAQGLNKIAQVIFLILNGSIRKGTILFWDEPETSLNPKYISVISNFIQVLAKAGIQLFIATHDYLLAHRLSLSAEYRAVENSVPDMKFLSLYKENVGGTQIESGATLAEIEHNPILDEYAALHDHELSLYQKSLK